MRPAPDYRFRLNNRRSTALGACLVLVASVVLIMSPQAAGHGGEVHSEPVPAKQEPTESDSALGPASRGGGDPRSGPDAGPAGEDLDPVVEGQQATTAAPPAPEVPESSPTVHFLALGVMALLGGAVILLLRRRNALG